MSPTVTSNVLISYYRKRTCSRGITAPIKAIPIANNADFVVRSLYKIKPLINQTIGCKARMIVELATEVSFNNPNHSAKCNSRNNSEKNNNSHSFWDIFWNSSRLVQTKGNNKIAAIHMRYILDRCRCFRPF